MISWWRGVGLDGVADDEEEEVSASLLLPLSQQVLEGDSKKESKRIWHRFLSKSCRRGRHG